MTVPKQVRAVVADRCAGFCEYCYLPLTGMVSLHHRIPRGMGGSKDSRLDAAANLIYLCGSGTTGCHGWVESHRRQARNLGLLLRRNDEPNQIPITDVHGIRWMLDDAGTKASV